MGRILKKPSLLQKLLVSPSPTPSSSPKFSSPTFAASNNAAPLPIFPATFCHKMLPLARFASFSPSSRLVVTPFPKFPAPAFAGRLPFLPAAFLHQFFAPESSCSSSPSCSVIASFPMPDCRRLPYLTFPIGSFFSSSHLSPIITNRNVKEIEECKYGFVERRAYTSFRETAGSWLLMRKRRRQLILLLIGGAIALTYFTHLEVVPCTYRRHFILIPPDVEALFGEEGFNMLKNELELQILPAFHPDSIRVQGIAKNVVEAVIEGAKASDSEEACNEFRKESAAFCNCPKVYDAEEKSSRLEANSNDALNDYRNKKAGFQKRKKTFTKHLERMKWEILVVDADAANAFCLAGGTIVVFTGFLKHFPSNEEIATVLGHEVAHVVARHPAEQLTRNIGLAFIELAALLFFYASDLIRTVSNLLFHLPFSRRMELEADQIGLLIMAAAGYDPRVAPALYLKISELAGVQEALPYHATHPSGKERAENLANTPAMEEALRIYQHKVTGRTAYRGYLL